MRNGTEEKPTEHEAIELVEIASERFVKQDKNMSDGGINESKQDNQMYYKTAKYPFFNAIYRAAIERDRVALKTLLSRGAIINELSPSLLRDPVTELAFQGKV